MSKENTFEIALFPIPNVVAFPGMAVPLHVFEPRYRTLINESVQASRMVGICHTEKEIRSAPSNQELETALKSNQATYKPFNIFSAGLCEVIETLEDGRIHVEIDISRRLSIREEIQTLPYRIVSAVEVVDSDLDDDHSALQTAVNERLITLVSDNNQLKTILQQEAWSAQSPVEFSFKLFQFLRFDPDIMQEVLEQTTVHERLSCIDQLLQRI